MIFFIFFSACDETSESPQVVVPLFTTKPVSGITSSSAISGGIITSDGGSSVTARGVCWSTSQNPTTDNFKTSDGTGTGAFTSTMIDLSPGTTYYVRAYATNSIGTGYGTQINFTTTANSTVTDIDGNVYHTITIGSQTWLVENLKTTRYRNGDPIPNVSDNATWYNLTTGAYCNYDNNTNYAETYGRLYNWYAVNDSRNIAPTGWHVATDEECMTLISILGGSNVAGGKLKETGTVHWQHPNIGATNVSGFTALPGGFRGLAGIFGDIGVSAYIWSASEVNINSAWFQHMNYSYAQIDRISYDKFYGFSVRCIKNQ